MLTYRKSPTAAGLVYKLIRWRVDLCLEEHFLVVTDNGSHFVNQLVKQFSESIGFEQSFSVAYSPWTNGAVETANRPLIQYAEGDHVLVSEHGTPSASEKTRLNWIGPYQVVEIVSDNVYQVESLLGKLKTVHGSRLWFYADKLPVGSTKLKSLFAHNFQSLEVESIIEIRLTRSAPVYYEVKVRWLGFQESDDTWEHLVSIYKYLSLMVRSFVENDLSDVFQKNSLLTYLHKLDQDQLNVSEDIVAQKPDDLIFQVRYIKTTNKDYLEQSRTLGWFQIEKEIFSLLVARYGCGKYEDYINSGALPFRSKQQLSSQLQSLLKIQSIGISHGLKFIIADANKFLADELGITTFHKNLPEKLNMLKEKEQIIRRFKEVCKEPEEPVAIPYFRRVSDPLHLNLMLSEYDANKYKDSYKEDGIHAKEDLEQLIKIHRDNYVSEIFSNESFIEDIYRAILENTDYWTTLADYRAVFTSTEHAMDFTANLAPSTRFNSRFGVITLSVLETGIILTYLSHSNHEKILLQYLSGNRYRIEGSLGDIYF
eukprot:augustus_masked-scaffold_16-processed-gene-1.7-mRNA-1 protein AED:0.39 eAED:0.39 QI:0/0/0/1/1/1/2/0/539